MMLRGDRVATMPARTPTRWAVMKAWAGVPGAHRGGDGSVLRLGEGLLDRVQAGRSRNTTGRRPPSMTLTLLGRLSLPVVHDHDGALDRVEGVRIYQEMSRTASTVKHQT